MSKTTKELQDAYSKYLWVRQKRYNELSSEISEEIDPLSDSTLLSHKEIVAQIDKEEVVNVLPRKLVVGQRKIVIKARNS